MLSCRAEVGEDECVYIFSGQSAEWECTVAQLFVEREVYLHFSIDGQVGIFFLHNGDSLSTNAGLPTLSAPKFE